MSYFKSLLLMLPFKGFPFDMNVLEMTGYSKNINPQNESAYMGNPQAHQTTSTAINLSPREHP